jgi:hypothetical protein
MGSSSTRRTLLEHAAMIARLKSNKCNDFRAMRNIEREREGQRRRGSL